MTEYIERKLLYELAYWHGEHPNVDNPYGNGVNAVDISDIDDIPTADVVPVVHGRWEWFDEDTGTPVTGYEREWGWRCAHCKEELPDDYDNPDCIPKMKYCSNCGAKMDKQNESEN